MSQTKDQKQLPSTSSAKPPTQSVPLANPLSKPDAKAPHSVKPILLKDLPPEEQELVNKLFAAIECESESYLHVLQWRPPLNVIKTDQHGKSIELQKEGYYDTAKVLRFYYTPLNAAIWFKQNHILWMLLDLHRQSPYSIERPSKEGSILLQQKDYLPLHLAAAQGDPSVISTLLRSLGLDDLEFMLDSSPSMGGKTPLHIAVEYSSPAKRLAVIKTFLTLGKSRFTALDQSPSFIDTLLLRSRAAIKQGDNRGETPLHLAVDLGDLAIVQMFLETKEGRDAVNQEDANGDTPFYRLLSKFLLGSLLPTSTLLSSKGVPPFYDADPLKKDGPVSIVISTAEKYLDIGVELLLKGADVGKAARRIQVISKLAIEDLILFASLLDRVQFKKAAKWVAQTNETSVEGASLSSKRRTAYTVEEPPQGSISKPFIEKGLNYHESTKGTFSLSDGNSISKGTISIAERDAGYVYTAEDLCLQEASKILQRWRQKKEGQHADYIPLVNGMLGMLVLVAKRHEAVLAASPHAKPETKHQISSHTSTSTRLDASSHTLSSSTFSSSLTSTDASLKPETKTEDGVVDIKSLPLIPRLLAEELFNAIENGEVEKVQKLIDQGARVDVRRNDYTPLSAAVKNGKLQVVRALLQMPGGRALLKQVDMWKRTPLHHAASSCDALTASALLEFQEGRETLTYQDILGNSPLHLTLDRLEDPDPQERLAVVAMFLDIPQGRAAVGVLNIDGTPLHLAVAAEDLAVTSALLKAEEAQVALNQVSTSSRYPGTPLEVAVRVGSFPLVKLLLDRPEYTSIVGQANKEVSTGLYLALSEIFYSTSTPLLLPSPTLLHVPSVGEERPFSKGYYRPKYMLPFAYDCWESIVETDEPISFYIHVLEEHIDIGVSLLRKGVYWERVENILNEEELFSTEEWSLITHTLRSVEYKKAGELIYFPPEEDEEGRYVFKKLNQSLVNKDFIKNLEELNLLLEEPDSESSCITGETTTEMVYIADDPRLKDVYKILAKQCQNNERFLPKDAIFLISCFAMLSLLTKNYEAQLAEQSRIKLETKEQTSTHASTRLDASNHTTLSSSQNQQADIQKAQVQQLSDRINAGDTTALKKVLSDRPFEQQSEPIQQYLQTQAVWAVLDAKTTPMQKSEQLALLAEAPGVSLLVENEQHQLPIDVALQQAAEGRIDSATVVKLQEATQQQLEKADEVVFDAIEKYAESALDREEKKSSAPVSRNSSDAVDDEKPITPQQLAGFVKEYRQNKAELKKGFLASSSSTSVTTSSTPPAISAISLSRMPARKMSAQQRKQLKDLFKRLVHQVISERFIKAVGIGQGWVEEVLSKKTTVGKTIATGVGGAILSVVLPGLGGIIASGASAGTEKAYRERQKVLCRRYTLGITSIEQLGLISNSLGRHLLYRYQDFLLQQNFLISPEVMKTFVDCLITRMFAYLQSIDNPDEIRALLGEKLVDLNKPHKVKQSAGSHTKLTPAIAEQIAENLAAGTSLLDLGLLDKLTTRGTDALLCCDTLDKGKRELRVSKICNSPAVALTATAEQESQQGGVSPLDLVYEGRYSQNLPNTTWVPGDCGVVCISRDEAELRHWNATEKWDGNLEIPQPQPEVIRLRAKVKELEQQVATAQARLSELEPEAERAETKAAMPTPPKTPLAPPKLPSRPPQPRTKPGMFGGRTPPTGQTPDAVSFGSGQPTGDAADVRTSPDNPSGQPTILQ